MKKKRLPLESDETSWNHINSVFDPGGHGDELPKGPINVHKQEQAIEEGEADSLSTERLLVRKINIAIDGYSGTGKSSTAKSVAKLLDYTYVDSGAMYRASTLYVLRKGVDVNDEVGIEALIPAINIDFSDEKVFLNGEDVSREIRSMEVNQNVSRVSSYRKVREAMVSIQKEIGKKKGVVMDGRDIGTVVFPDAELKVFMTSNLEVRARRRQAELLEKGYTEALDQIMKNLEERDNADSSRKESPLIRAEKSIEVDTSDLTFDEQVRKIVKLAKAVANES